MSVLAVTFPSLFEQIIVPERSMFPVAKQSTFTCSKSTAQETHNGFMKGTPVYLGSEYNVIYSINTGLFAELADAIIDK